MLTHEERVKKRVKNGATLLDSHIPGWRNKINLDILDIGSCFNCIVGQIFGGYCEGLEILFDIGTEDQQIMFGFEGEIDYHEGYSYRGFDRKLLTECWKQYIIECKQEQKSKNNSLDKTLVKELF